MGVYEHFPYSDYHNLNIDWVLQTTKRLEAVADDLDTEITNEVDAQLAEMVEDGTLSDIINQELLSDINDAVDALENDLGAITPLDAAPTNGSTKGVTSDGVYDAVTNIENNMESVAKQISLIPGKNIVFIGDSLTVGTGATNPATERYSTLVAKKFEMNEKNFGVGGAGFTRPNTFISQLNSANSTLSAQEKEDTYAVVICGGANDFRYASDTTRQTFLNNVVATFIRAREVFPDAIIYSAIGNGILDRYTDTDRYWTDLANDELMKLSDYGKIFVIKNVADCVNGRAAVFVSDGLHLTTEGHALFAGFIANAMMGGSTNTEYYVGTYSWDNTKVSGTPTIPHIFRYNNFILFGQGVITLAADISENTLVGSYTGPYEYNNLYLDMFQGNQRVGSFGLGTTGAVRIIPDTGVTLAANSNITLRDYVGVFRQYIPPA